MLEHLLNQYDSALAIAVILSWVAILCLSIAHKRLLMGTTKMPERTKLSKEVCEIIEDKFVDGLTEAIAAKRLTIEEARQLYARLAHFGFWGLHPRKFTPKKTQEDLDALKAQLLAARSAREISNSQPTVSIVDKLLDGVEADLKRMESER
jgi:hypothetical protein